MSSQPYETTATTIAIVLAGGASSRLGGTDKTRVQVAGATTLERVLRSAAADQRIVVGPAGDDGAALAHSHVARFVLEDPPRSGPLAALARGVAEIPGAEGTSADSDSGATVLVLGGDMPLLRAETLAALASTSASEQKVAALAGSDGHVQYLCAAWPLARLRAALGALAQPDGGWANLSLRRLYDQLETDELLTRAAAGAEGADIDTPDALEAAVQAAGPRIALAQVEVSEDVEVTQGTVRAAVGAAAAAGAQLVLLPEATLTPFGTDLRAVSETHHASFEQLIQELADEHHLVVVAGSFTPADGDRVHNTVIARGPADENGPVDEPRAAAAAGAAGEPGAVRADYRKIHLFDAYGSCESETVAPGDELVMIDLGESRLGIATCYDVRFPEQFAALARRGAQAILLPLAWADGPGKSEQLRLLLQARALDSTTVVLAADQAPPAQYTGTAARGIGQSAVIGPLGQIRQELGREPGLLLVDLDLAEVREARAALPVLEHGVPLPRD
ncbi:nitrilase-related carbon-nitrogen hydrolase [Brachybacterium tyrofermentans]|uniref:nitrilase-related carbon-nitrogen hydrolase n=1 Tax=Brachybacterium tyrofermentans TaxID=47848 RepID=UPI0018686C55|nr:nitrilase-related carbon-nitrogen hydrolase [Brachybacterium tyrofermentans]